jgi:hypothetical protein
VVSCRAVATGGTANHEILRLVAGWLELPAASVEWEQAGRRSAKRLRVLGIDDAEIDRRLSRAASPIGDPTTEDSLPQSDDGGTGEGGKSARVVDRGGAIATGGTPISRRKRITDSGAKPEK